MKVPDDFAEKLLGVPNDSLDELTKKIGKYSANPLNPPKHAYQRNKKTAGHTKQNPV
jgi:hypothetical protein